PGPVGKYLKVIDYDATNQCYYRPVDLDDPGVLIRSGLDPAESDPQFHQQMVYAVASETIRRFELALGRSIRWSFARWMKAGEAADECLRIFPHAMQEPNAFYSRDLRGLLFGYFPASMTEPGANKPGQTVYTCLSHDIIAHETTHALVDSQRDYFMEPTGPDAPAFHEAFADIVALFQHFTFKDALLDTIQRTGGRIYRLDVPADRAPATTGAAIEAELSTTNPLVELAQQFGEAMGMRKALRSALGTPPNSKRLDVLFEPHARGSILVAAVFDAFFSVFVRRTEDLWRIAQLSPIDARANGLPPDLANRLADAAVKTAEEVLNICIRALDYCPPVDIRFGDFLRAMITADSDLVPDDPNGYRPALIDAFRSRGIVAWDAASYSEESLRWATVGSTPETSLPPCTDLWFDLFKQDDPAAHTRAQRHNGQTLNAYAVKNQGRLGLSTVGGTKIWAQTFHEVHRVRPDGETTFAYIAELTQQQKVPIDAQNPAAGSFTFRGGTTLILDRQGNVRYAIQKPLGDQRLEEQRAYQEQRAASLDAAAYLGPKDLGDELADAARISFRLVHQGGA
ncbi:MAG TPA: peptidase M4, partial [Candidatus Limnocylindria bacterium]